MGSFTMELTALAIAKLADPDATGCIRATVHYSGPNDYEFVAPILIEIDRGEPHTDSSMEEATPAAAARIAQRLASDWYWSGVALGLIYEDMAAECGFSYRAEAV